MKKLIYIMLFAAITAMSVSACTEEEVNPNAGPTSGGTEIHDPK